MNKDDIEIARDNVIAIFGPALQSCNSTAEAACVGSMLIASAMLRAEMAGEPLPLGAVVAGIMIQLDEMRKTVRADVGPLNPEARCG